MNKQLQAKLHNEMIELILSGVKEQEPVVETLSIVLYEEHGYDWDKAEKEALAFYNADYANAFDEAEEEDRNAREAYYDKVNAYYSLVGACYE